MTASTIIIVIQIAPLKIKYTWAITMLLSPVYREAPQRAKPKHPQAAAESNLVADNCVNEKMLTNFMIFMLFFYQITKAYEELRLWWDPAKAMLSMVIENPEKLAILSSSIFLSFFYWKSWKTYKLEQFKRLINLQTFCTSAIFASEKDMAPPLDHAASGW